MIRKLLKYVSGKNLTKIPGITTLYNNILSKFLPNTVEVHGLKMYVNPKDRYISLPLILNRTYEENVTKVFKRIVKKGMVVIDIGANIGYYTLLAAKLVGKEGKVLAFEPEPSNFNLLTRNVKLNKFEDRCILINKAVSNFVGTAKLYLSDENPGDHTLLKDNKKGKWIKVQTTTIDHFLNYELNDKIKEIDVIKMDIQGNEMAALEGMVETISKSKNLKMFVEFWPHGIKQAGFSPVEFLKKIESLGFLYFLITDDGKIAPIKDRKQIIELANIKGHLNLFMIKKDCLKLFKKEITELSCTWDAIYSKVPSTFEFLADNILHLHYLLEIIKLRPKKVLEVGCGTASHSIFLSFFLPKTEFYCLDNNKKVLEIARKNAQKYRRKNIKFILGDAFKLSSIFQKKEFKVAISQGLLEHFSNEEIQKLIDEQLQVAHVVIINVPSEYYPHEGILGERRISKEEWRDILKKYSKKYKIEIKNLIDIGIRTRMLALKRSLRFSLKPMHYLIVIKGKVEG